MSTVKQSLLKVRIISLEQWFSKWSANARNTSITRKLGLQILLPQPDLLRGRGEHPQQSKQLSNNSDAHWFENNLE